MIKRFPFHKKQILEQQRQWLRNYLKNLQQNSQGAFLMDN